MTPIKEPKQETVQELSPEAQALVDMLAEQAAKIAELEARVEVAEAGKEKIQKDDGKPLVRDDTPQPGGAWLIKAPLDGYNEKTAGVKFTNGWGVVYPDMKDASRIVHQLENDFHYTVVSVDADTLAAFHVRMSGAQPSKPASLAEKLSQAQVYP